MNKELQFLMYSTPNENITINAVIKDETISVGYRVNSGKATNFRIWATSILKEYMTKGGESYE